MKSIKTYLVDYNKNIEIKKAITRIYSFNRVTGSTLGYNYDYGYGCGDASGDGSRDGSGYSSGSGNG